MEQLADSALVELAREGESRAFAELYRRYFDPVYDFVARMTRDRDEAADIAQDTFLRAMGALGGLRQGASFKSWIFTIARNATLNRLERSSRTRPLSFEGEDGEPVDLAVIDQDRFANPAEAAEAAAIASLVWQAAAGLDPKQLTLLDLHLRQGLDSAEIASVLNVTKNNGYVMLNRLKKAVEDAIGAFIMWKDGPRYCEALASELEEARTAAMSPAVRRLVERHVAGCEDCKERKRRLVSPLAAFGAFAAIGPPAGVRAHILEGLMKEWPGPAAQPAGGPPRGEPPASGVPAPGAGGFPANGLRLLMGLGTAAALVLGAIFIPASPFALTGGDGGAPPSHDASPAATSAAGSPSPTAPPTSTAKGPTGTATNGTKTATSGKTPTAGGSGGTATPPPPTAAGSPGSSPSPTSTATATLVSPTATATPTPTTAPCASSLATNVTSLSIAPGNTQTFLAYDLFLCGPLGFVVSGSAPWIEVDPTTGTIGTSGALIAVRVEGAGLPEGKHTGTVTVTGVSGGGSATVNISTTVTGSSPEVERATGSCPPTGAQWSFAAHASDDYGVSSVRLRYAASGNQTTLSMSGPNGAASGDWTLTLAPLQGATNFVVIATDGAGQQTVASVSGNCE